MTPSPNFQRFYNAFKEIITVVHASTRLEEVTELVVWKVSEIIKAKGAILRLLNLETDELEISASYGIGEAYLKKGPTSSHQVISELCLQNKVIMIDDIQHDPRVQYPLEAQAEGIRFIVDVPLSIANDVIGILRIFFSEIRSFTEDELNFIVAIGEQCSCALGKARLIETHELKYHQLALQTEKLSALGRMAAGIAHEINNPLAGILLYSSNLVKKVDPGSPLGEGLEIIIHETIRCRKIIQELLDFSRGREPQKSLEDLNRVIERTLTILENEFKLKHLTVTASLAPDLEPTMLDANQLEQVFVNLLINAVEALPEGGSIAVSSSIERSEGMIRVEIRDNGPGIDEAVFDKVFEPFFSTKARGTGLGLSVSYGIVHQHQGRIRLQSSPGQGTCFTVEIPLVPEPDHGQHGQHEESDATAEYPDNR